jgi:hypothetical protein
MLFPLTIKKTIKPGIQPNPADYWILGPAACPPCSLSFHISTNKTSLILAVQVSAFDFSLPEMPLILTTRIPEYHVVTTKGASSSSEVSTGCVKLKGTALEVAMIIQHSDGVCPPREAPHQRFTVVEFSG